MQVVRKYFKEKENRMEKKLLLVLSLMLVMSIFLTGCRAAAVSAKTGKTFVFTDSIGRKVELPSHLTRISPSGAIAAMILYAAAPEKLVSICRQPDEAYKKYYTKEYLRLPSTGQIYGIADINLEELINLSPQVIIDLGDIKKDMAADIVIIDTRKAYYYPKYNTLSSSIVRILPPSITIFPSIMTVSTSLEFPEYTIADLVLYFG
jgi:ABC-type Fe3+-hydroxamate transport system substrate-binding protein